MMNDLTAEDFPEEMFWKLG